MCYVTNDTGTIVAGPMTEHDARAYIADDEGLFMMHDGRVE